MNESRLHDSHYLFSDGSSESTGVCKQLAARLAGLLGRTIRTVHDTHSVPDLLDGRCASPFVFLVHSECDHVLDLIRSCAARPCRPALVAIGPADDVRGAVDVIRAGAEAYFTADELDSLADQIRAGEFDARRPSVSPGDEAFAPIVTRDRDMQALFHTARLVARSSVAVLITGETGVGKELLADGLHRASGRRGAFVAENVAGLDDPLFSDALFGHRRGAYTGATGDRQGLVERAAEGTLFLDEIGDITAYSQVKLLRLLENRSYYPLGSDEIQRSNARVILATNHDLLERVKQGAFRLDLYFRLAAFHLHVPPLRLRKHDIPLLVEHFADQTAQELHIRRPRFTPQLMPLLEGYDYPGNVRELQSIVVTLVSHGRDDRLEPESLEGLARSVLYRHASTEHIPTSGVTFPEALPTIDQVTDQLIDEALRRTDGNQSAAARILGISASAVNKRLTRRPPRDGGHPPNRRRPPD